MKTALIYVFSGTGSTSLTAKLLCGHLEARGVKTTVYNVKSTGSPPPPGDYDYIGFGYPVYAYNLPEIFYRFAQSLPAGSSKAFIFKTSGEPFRLNRVSSCKLIKCLKRKGYDVVLEQHLLMPYNILFRYPDALAKQMYIYSDALCALLAARLTAGERDALKFNPLSRFASFLFRIQWPGARLNGRLYSANKSKCVKCMRCVKDCPAANISLKEGRIAFGLRCVMCMRCAMYCPADAINIGLLRPFKVHGAYDFDRVLDDPSIPSDFIGPYTKGYFKLFRKFFSNADAMLSKYGISVCDSEYDAEYCDSDNTISQ